MNHNRTILVIILTVALFVEGTIAAHNPSVRYFRKDVYHAATQNWDVACTPDRFTFFANNDGVLMFDSGEWTLFRNRNRTNVRSLYYDRDNAVLYVGSTNELGKIEFGLDCREAPVYRSMLDTLDVTATEIWSIGKIGGKVWFQDDRHIYLLDGNSVRVYGFDKRIYCASVIDDKLYIYVSGEGCLYFNSGRFEAIEGTESLRKKRVCAIMKIGDNLGFVTRLDGVFILDSGKLVKKEYPFSSELGNDKIYTAATDGENIAFGTVTNGVFIYNNRSGEWYNLNTDSGLGNNTVLSLRFDEQKNIWAGLDNGVAHINLSAAERELFAGNDVLGTGYASCVWKGKLYLGTNQGLFVTDKSLTAKSIYSRCNNGISQVWDLSVRNGELFCCHDSGIYIMYPDGSESTIPLNGTWKLDAPTGEDDLLVGSTYDHFFRLTKTPGGKWKFAGFIKGADDASKSFCFDDGKMWLAHWVKGLFRLTFNEEFTEAVSCEYFGERNGFPTSFNNYPNVVDGKVLFSTEGGFYEFDNSRNLAVPVDSLNRRFNFTPVAMRLFPLPDGDDFYSSGTVQALGYRDNAGDYRLDSLSIRYMASRRPLGFENLLYLEEGKVLINTEDGFSVINTAMLKNRKPEVTPLIIRRVRVIKGGKETTVLENTFSKETELRTLNPDENTLRFTFRMVEYRQEQAIIYSCLMEGYDSDWSLPGVSCSKDYTKLPYGHHIFRVRAYNAVTGQSDETALDVIIKHPWYLTNWAYFLYAFLAICLLVALYYIARAAYRRRIAEVSRRKEKEMEEEQMKNDLLHKANDLATSTMNLLRKNEELMDIQEGLNKTERMLRNGEKPEYVIGQIVTMRENIDSNIRHDDDWKKFEKNFDIVYDEYLTRLGNTFPELTVSDKKLCAYLKMDLSSKEIAPLMNLTYRSVEMTRYRLRKKLNLSREQNLIEFLQRF